MSAFELLHRAGWTQFRRVDVDETVSRLQASGYAVVPPYRELIAQLLGLVVLSEDGKNSLEFDMDGIAARTDAELCEAYGEDIGRAVTPVGFYSDMVLWVDEVGEFWGSFDLQYGRIGQNIQEVIQWLLVDPASMHMFDRRLPD
ncbi:SUKH-3 domain-containing protein [Cellulomonas cellasea]|nr:SUKH-3 domain-containing protein [Cellulomonas cellasea]GEA87707.1 hypothetical protein CCE01nite_16560 [Cellulomonas cellasea]